MFKITKFNLCVIGMVIGIGLISALPFRVCHVDGVLPAANLRAMVLLNTQLFLLEKYSLIR